MARKWLKPENGLSLVLLWTLYLGLTGALLAFIFRIIAAAGANDWDLRLIPLPIIAAAVIFAAVGMIFGSAHVLFKWVAGKRRRG
jgi:ABC-type polysaccharide/polyol phosphate export permease